MSTKEQRSKLIQGLQDYFDNTSPEQLEKDGKELEQFNQYGPDIEECLELGRQHCMEMMKELNMNKEDYIRTGTFPKIWESKGPTIDKYLMQKLIELEQEIKALKELINNLKENQL